MKDFSPEARQRMIEARKVASYRPVTASEIKKYEAKQNIVISESNETHYEMLQRNAKQNLPSSLR